MTEMPRIPDGFEPISKEEATRLSAPKIPDGFEAYSPSDEEISTFSSKTSLIDKADQPITDPKQVRDLAKAQGSGVIDGAKNIAAGMGERVIDLFGGFGDLVAAAAPSDQDGVVRALPNFMYSDKGAPEQSNAPTKSELQAAAQTMHDTSLGYKPGTTWEDVKKSPAANFIPFAIEQGLVSAPDMAAAMAALPAYIAARTGELADQRAENDAAQNATVEDLLLAMPAATASALLDRIGGRAMFGLDDVAVQSLKQVPKEVAKATVKEGLTEGAQEGIESVATTVGTQKGFDPAQTGEQMLAGALAGGVTGGAVRAATGTLEAGTNQPVEGDQSATVETETPPLQAPATQDGGEERVSPLASSPSSAISPTERAILRATAIPDEDIDQMSREEIVAKVAEAKAGNVSVSGDQIRAAAQYASPAVIFANPGDVASETADARPVPPVAETDAAPVERPVDRMRREYEARKVSDQQVDQQAEQAVQSVSPELAATVLRNVYEDTPRQPVPVPAPVDTTPAARAAAERMFSQYQAKNAQADQAASSVLPDLEEVVRQSISGDQRADANVDQALGAPLSTAVLRSLYEENRANRQTPQAPSIDMQAVESDLIGEKLDSLKAKRDIPLNKQGLIIKPDSLIEFIAKRGGVREATGELKSTGLNDAKTGFVSGVYDKGRGAPVIRKDGVHPDKALEAAVQAGYLPEGSTLTDFYDAMAQDARTGRQVFAQGDMEWGKAWQDQQGGEARQAEQDAAEADPNYQPNIPTDAERERQAIYIRIMDEGYPGTLGDDFSQRVARFAMAGESFEDAVFYARDEMLQDAASMAVMPAIPEIPFFGDENNAAFAGTTAQGSQSAQAGGFPGDDARGEVEAGRTGDDLEVRGESGPEAEIGRGREDGQRSDREGESNRPAPVKAPVASWVVREKATGNVVLETFEKRTADAINKDKYEAVPIQEHLASLSKPKQEPTDGVTDTEDSELLDGFPQGYRFSPGKGLAKGKWAVVDENGKMVWNYGDTKDEAVKIARNRLRNIEISNAEKAAQAKAEAKIRDKLFAGEDLNDNDLKTLSLRDTTGFEYLSPVVQRLFGLSNRKVREAMGDALKKTYTDFGVEKWRANTRAALANAARFAKPSEEAGADGKPQTVIPGAERVSDADMAQRKADAPLKPKVAQKEAGGLFSDERDQKDLLDLSVNPASATNTAAFKKWFGASKVVDDNGEPLVVYHGTDSDITSFDPKMRGRSTQATSSVAGFFFTSDPVTARSYADYAATIAPVNRLIAEANAAEAKGDWDTYDRLIQEAEEAEATMAEPDGQLRGQNIVPAYLSIQNPLIVDAKGENPDGIGGIDPIIKRARRSGHDGVIIKNLDDAANISDRPSNHYIVFNPTKIKSVNNRGTFDPADSRIDYSAPSGWDMADTGEPAALLSEAEQKRLAEIVLRTSGLNPEFVERINVPANAPGLMAWGKGGEEGSTAAGFYANMRDVITLALDTAPVRADKVAYHESFHRLQNLFLTDKERNLLKANDAKLRKMIADRGEYSEDIVSRMSRKEVEAEAFGIWANGQDNGGLHIGIRKVWKNIRDMLARVRNYLKGRGYQTVEDVFGKAKSGEIAKRAKDERRAAENEFSIAPAVDTPAFKRWFGKSKVVDDNGEPLKVYHGTQGTFDAFNGIAWVSPDRDFAVEYSEMGGFNGRPVGRPRVIEAYASIERPFNTDLGLPSFLPFREFAVGAMDQAADDGRLTEAMAAKVRDLIDLVEAENPAAQEKHQFWNAGWTDYTRQLLNALEFDGLQFIEDGKDTFGALSSSQIKSVNNRGTFDPNDDRINYAINERTTSEDVPAKPKASVPNVKPRGRFSDRLGLASKALAAKIKSKGGRYDRLTEGDEETLADLTTRKVLDYLDPVLKMQEKVGGNLNDYADAYLTARLAEGTIRHELHVADEKYVQPAIKELAQVGATEEDLHRYMYAMHAPERNRVVGLRNEEGSDLYKAATDPSIRGASGMSTNEAKETLAELAKDREKFMGIRRAAAHIRAMLDNGLHTQLKAGLINKATYERLTQQWQNYVPLRAESDQDGTAGGAMPKKSRGFDVRGDEFKGATGRYTKADNVVTYAINDAEQAIIRAEKNKAATAALRFINQFDPQGESIAKVYWSEDPDKLGDITKAPPVYKRTLDKDGKVTNVKVNAFQMKDDVLAAKVGGKTYYMQFADPKVGLALKKMTFGELGVAMKMVRTVSNWQSLINTRANPAFVPINMLRDIQTGATIALSKDFKVGEIASMVAGIPRAWGALWRDARGKPGDGKWDKIVADFKANGGKISFDQYNTIEETAKKIKKDLARAGTQGIAGKSWRGLIDLIENLNDTIENGMRVAIYDAAVKQGKTPKRAAFLARDMTVDFQKKGEIAPHMNALYTFFNASMQGNFNFAKALYKSRKVKVAMGALVVAGYAAHIANMAAAGDDDDGENAYLKMLRNEPWTFERNIVIFIPGTKEYIKLPLGFGMNAFWHMGVQAGAVTTGDKGFLDATLDSTRVAFDAFNPLGSGGWVSMALPSVIDPIWELGTNQDFSGKPIYPQENQYDPAPPPKSEQAFSSTGPAFRWGAEMLNKISGGNKVLPGAVDVYPDSLEYLWGWFTGGLGRFVSQGAETAQRGVNMEFEPKKTPFVRSFYGEVDDAGKRSEYFSQREKVQFVKGKAKEFGEAGDEEALNDFIKANQRDYDAISAFDATEKQRRKLNKQRRMIEKQNLPDAKSLLEDLDKQELELMNEARKTYFELGKP